MIIVDRNKTLYFLKASSDYRSLTLENNFNVAGSINGVAVGKLANTRHPKFFIIEHPVDNYFGLFYSWSPAERQGNPTSNPVRFRYFIFEYTGSHTLDDQLKQMYPPPDTPNLGFVLPYVGGTNSWGWKLQI